MSVRCCAITCTFFEGLLLSPNTRSHYQITGPCYIFSFLFLKSFLSNAIIRRPWEVQGSSIYSFKIGNVFSKYIFIFLSYTIRWPFYLNCFKTHFYSSQKKCMWCKISRSTYVLSRHSWQFELDKLQRNQKLIFSSENHISRHFDKTLNYHTSQAVWAFEIILKLRVRPKYHLSYVNKCLGV